MNKIAIPSFIIVFLVTSLIGYGQLRGEVTNNKESVKKVEVKQEKMDEYLMEQREINTEQKVNLEYIKKMLEKIDQKTNV